jgi:hypothetical protein
VRVAAVAAREVGAVGALAKRRRGSVDACAVADAAGAQRHVAWRQLWVGVQATRSQVGGQRHGGRLVRGAVVFGGADVRAELGARELRHQVVQLLDEVQAVGAVGGAGDCLFDGARVAAADARAVVGALADAE